MKTFFTVDRNNWLTEGKSNSLLQIDKRHPLVSTSNHHRFEIKQYHAKLFPNGISKHGDSYLKSNSDLSIIEVIFELVRSSYYPDKPSRLTSFFGFETVDQANIFNQEYGNNNSIFEVQPSSYFKADMKGLTLRGATSLDIMYNADKYWRGESCSDNPFWEILLVPVIKTIGKV